ncbi:MAG: FAD-binding oxidoreductase [Hyphomicrobiaceae bacterium]
MQRISELKSDLDGLQIEDNPRRVQMKSRDFYWYSPILKQQLDPLSADLLVTPRTEAEIARVLSACFSRDVPVTPRGAGTGNYGQAVPLAGGVVMDLSRMAGIKRIDNGRAVVEPGVVLFDLENKARNDAALELRMHPSTAETATVGGFVAGGSAGVGSIRWGGLYDIGNILRLEVMTLESEPRRITLTGEAIRLAQHAYGTTGIITEIELPLAPTSQWIDVLVGFDDWIAGLRCGEAIAFENGLLLRQLGVIEAPIPYDCFKRHQALLRRDQSLMVLTVAAESLDPVLGIIARSHGEVLHSTRLASAADREELPAGYLLCWNHTTLRALRVDPAITYLQIGYPANDPIAAIERIGRRLGEEVPGHVEFRRTGRGTAISGLPLVRFTTAARLDEIIAFHEAEGCINWSAHHCTLEEGGGHQLDVAKLAFKRQVDPKGLLNPGKMIGFEDPGYDFAARAGYRYPGIRRALS